MKKKLFALLMLGVIGSSALSVHAQVQQRDFTCKKCGKGTISQTGTRTVNYSEGCWTQHGGYKNIPHKDRYQDSLVMYDCNNCSYGYEEVYKTTALGCVDERY